MTGHGRALLQKIIDFEVFGDFSKLCKSSKVTTRNFIRVHFLVTDPGPDKSKIIIVPFET
jgi:hypothetical protein